MTLATIDESGNSPSWQAIFDRYEIADHDFDTAPFPISAEQIKRACQHFTKPAKRKCEYYASKIRESPAPKSFGIGDFSSFRSGTARMSSSKARATWKFRTSLPPCRIAKANFPSNWRLLEGATRKCNTWIERTL